MNRILIALLLALTSLSVSAQTRVSNLTAASALDGTELIYCVQGSADRKCTGTQIKTLTSASPTLVTPVLGVATGTSLSLSSTTDSTSTTTGALIVSGGVGIAKALNVGTTLIIGTDPSGLGSLRVGGNTWIGGHLLLPQATFDIGDAGATGQPRDIRISRSLYTGSDANINGLTVGRGGGNISSNTAAGVVALANNSAGANNAVYGFGALNSNGVGNNNTAIGLQAGFGPAGVNANTSGNSNVYVGYYTVGSANNNTNEIVIGANAVGNGSNTVTLGDGNIVTTMLRGRVQLGGTTNGFPALRQSGAQLDVVAADNSAWADLAAAGIILNLSSSPGSGTACTAGRITWDASYIYVCTSSMNWKRVALTGSY